MADLSFKYKSVSRNIAVRIQENDPADLMKTLILPERMNSLTRLSNAVLNIN